MSRVLVLAALVLSLVVSAGCATAVLNNTASGDASADYPTLQQDNRITRELRTKIYRDALLGDERIHVSTAQGVVTLSGTVSNRQHANRAMELARSIEGVRGINLELKLRGTP